MTTKKPRGQVTAVGYTEKADGSIEFHGEVDPEVRRQILEERAAMLERRGKRRELWGEIGPEAMTRLGKMFPSLREADGIEPWDAMKLLEWLCTSGAVTGGSFWAALFVLGVWNDMDWSEAAKELDSRTCPRCGGVGRVDEDGEKVRRGAIPEKFVQARYDDDDNRLPDVVVKTIRCDGCDGKGEYQPSLKTGRFSIYRALGVWDDDHKRAFETWVKYPYWP